MTNSIASSNQHVNRSRLDEIGMGDPLFTAEIIDIMLEDGAMRVKNIRAACNSGYFDEAGKLAHSLKGAALNVGASELANMCALIDDSVRKSGVQFPAELVSEIEAEFTAVAVELSQIKSELSA